MKNETSVLASATSVDSAVLIPLSELGVVSVSGADAVAFLQSQVTTDVARLKPDELQLSGYCTPKGRLLATFHQWRTEDEIFLRMPRELVTSIVKRLSMFVLRSKAKVVDVSDAWSTHAIVGRDAARALRDAGAADVPDAPYTAALTGDLRIDRALSTPSGMERFLVTSCAGVALPIIDAFARVSADRWWLSEIEAAVPTVFAATQEKFVPQMINFEVLGGVDFKKGCYPGQEVVARSQYLGKLKRRMNVAHADAPAPARGADVFADGSEQPVGTVVMAASAIGGGSELLFEARIDRVEAGPLRVERINGPQLTLRPLPYALFDPTE